MSITRILTVTFLFSSFLLIIVSANVIPHPKPPADIPDPKPIDPAKNPVPEGDRPGKQAREFLDAHNRIRATKGQPPLVWDNQLAKYAKQWAAERINDCKMIHSNGPHGENLFWGGQDHWTPTKVVDSWASEAEFYNEQTHQCKPGEMCGHYTQIVWRDTQRVGCTRRKCNNGGYYFVCSYDPPGNYVDENPFGGKLR
ncbi:Pathogenesis-related protein 1 [Melia azedarach]|uniref:Pathogenesis-related protein 1 n=1 Tax=Melia azedarach TaxID=155640 RepID=A0ACC1X0W0_MELAZ|nr:Pathogenesis-related protein 1 [Melia azedarach]